MLLEAESYSRAFLEQTDCATTSNTTTPLRLVVMVVLDLNTKAAFTSVGLVWYKHDVCVYLMYVHPRSAHIRQYYYLLK